jgi:arylsulfatase A-like enzyme/Tfp pilus assembly protein PilF
MRFFLSLLCLFGALKLSCAATATKSAPATQRPSIILITLDTTRADRMGFLGSHRGLTPNLDSLAKQSVVFARAYAQVPLTTPSHAAILSGTYPQFNHLVDLGMPLSKDLPYLPELLHQRGYRTAAFVGAMILNPKGFAASGFGRGFDLYDADFHKREPGESRYKSVERRAGDVVDHALAWLKRRPPGPFFLWIHVYDAHDPYDPPEPYKTRYASEPYDGEIAYTDSAMGKLFAELHARALYENTVIAVMADHGEAFGEHNEERHGMFLYDETIHVPLLVKFPHQRFAGKSIADRVRLVDVAPTILKEARVTVPAAMQGQALQDLVVPQNKISATSGIGDRPAYAETDYPHRAFGWSPLQSWRTGKYLYIQAPKRELYDQAADPFAQHNLAATSAAVSNTVASAMKQFVERTSNTSSAQAQIDPAQAEQLRALGYLASDSKTEVQAGDQGSVDPKDKIEIANVLHQALVDTENDDYEAAVPKLERVIQQEPNTHAAYLELGRAWIHQKQYDKALPMLQKAVELAPDSPMALYELGLAMVKTGQWEAAVSPFEGAVTHAPNSAEMHFYLGAVYARLKRLPDAAHEFETTLQIDPSHYQANLVYGHMLVLERQPEAALPKLRKAAEVKPESGEPHKYLADAYLQLGQQANAERERALAERLRPGSP